MAPDKQPPKPVLVSDERFGSVIRRFMAESPKWTMPPPRGYSDMTKETWGRELRLMARPDTLGAVLVSEIRPSLVQCYFDGIADLPGKCQVGLSALKQLEKWAIVREVLPRQITLGVEIEPSSGDGHIPWTDAQVIFGEQNLRADLARVVTLGANTGQRGSDLIRMGPTDIEVYNGIRGINVVQKKTGRQVWVPITSALEAAMATWERRPGPFLLRPDGRLWTRKRLTAVFMDAAAHFRELNGLHPHGLRGHACVRLRRAGATILQIADMVGMSAKMVERYCRHSDQRENATAAVLHLERTLGERNSGMAGKRGS